MASRDPEPSMMKDAPLAVAVTVAIRTGAVETLEQLLEEHPDLATTTIVETDAGGRRTGRSLLHVATDWPGRFPNGPATVKALVSAGADVNARFLGSHTETPLHWAASTDDVAVLDALLDAGADIEARGAVIGGGTAIADATAFGQWKAARRLLERGAKTNLWEASALGLMSRVDDLFRADPAPDHDQLTRCFWGACHGGQRQVAEYLLSRGADPNWVGWDGLTALDAASRSKADDLVTWLRSVGALSRGDVK